MRRRELEAARTRTADGEELWKSTNCQTVGDALNGHRRRRHHHHRQLLSSLPPAQPSGGLRSTCPPSHRKKPSGSSGLPVRSLSLSLSLFFIVSYHGQMAMRRAGLPGLLVGTPIDRKGRTERTKREREREREESKVDAR